MRLFRPPSVGTGKQIVVIIAGHVDRFGRGQPTGAVEDVVPGDTIGIRMAAEGVERPVWLQGGVVKNKFTPAAKFSALAGFNHRSSQGIFVRATAFSENIAKNVKWTFGSAGRGDMLIGAVDVVAPDAHIHVGTFAFDAVVPHAANNVAVDIGVPVGAAFKAIVRAAADGVVEAVVFGREDFVITNDIATRGIDEGDALGTAGMAGVPVIGRPSGAFQQVALNDQVASATLGKNGAVGPADITEGPGTANSPPEGDAAIFNDDMMPTPSDQDAVPSSVF